ncbi:MAG: PAS domain S-box protein [Pseudomonadota bacterium]
MPGLIGSRLDRLRLSLVLKIVISIIALLAVLMVGLFVVNVRKYEATAVRNAAIQADETAEIIKAGLRTAMRHDPLRDTAALLADTARLDTVESLTLYDKRGVSRFSGVQMAPVGPLPLDHALCAMCHDQEPPATFAPLERRAEVISSDGRGRLVRVVSPIANEPGCTASGCHAGQDGAPLLGVMELTVSMENIEGNIALLVKDNATYVIFSLVAICLTLFGLAYRLIDRPIARMIEGTRRIALGDYAATVDVDQRDELGQLASAINRMAREVGIQHEELAKQRTLYQSLFEGVPCLITVQDRDYRLIRFNQTFAERFKAKPGDHCYHAYKGRDRKCEVCPVEKTFSDGKSHTAEEVGAYKDGSRAHWIVHTAPIHDERGEVVAAMEMCLDITQRKRLEEDLKASEQKYCAIFNNIPSAVLALDAGTLEVVDCNQTAIKLYGYKKGVLIRRSALKLVAPDEAEAHREAFATARGLRRTKHVNASGSEFWASVNVTRSRFEGREVLLAAVTDISERIRSEEQLIQASKMATLGEMATGVAHELNQPLAVLQMVANLFRRKVKAGQSIDPEAAAGLADKISNNVGRATRIITHMREFGRKSNLEAEEVQINDVMRRAFDFFSQQLKLHDIDVAWQLDDHQPTILADPNRLEQVFINMLLNARDAIDERCARGDCDPGDRLIVMRTRSTRRSVIAEVQDTGTGIPKHLLPRLFEPFFTTKEVGQGTGLGLSISYGIVTDYGGTIRATSPACGGSRFVITFPRASTMQNGHGPA